jgi:hypothetical protein
MQMPWKRGFDLRPLVRVYFHVLNKLEETAKRLLIQLAYRFRNNSSTVDFSANSSDMTYRAWALGQV